MRNFLPFLILFLVPSTVLLSHLLAQVGTGTITGTIQDSAGSVFVSAKVALEPSERQVATDDQGEFRIANLPAGEYTLTASYVGFNPYTTTVKVEAGKTANLTVALQVGSQADSVLVTAERLQGEAEAINVERMSANIVQVLPITVIQSLPNKNIADAVQNVRCECASGIEPDCFSMQRTIGTGMLKLLSMSFQKPFWTSWSHFAMRRFLPRPRS